MAENVKVIVRCRPMNKRERELNCESVIRMQNCVVETWDPQEGPSFPKQFTFDSVYDQDSITETVYNDICYPLIESVLEGYNSTIFVYGQTGCGKSFTMEGLKSDTLEKSGNDKGIIARAFEHVFEAISVTSGVTYLALVSYLEIYNEQIRDLLLPSDKTNAGGSLSLKEIPNEGVQVSGLSTHPVHNVAECEHLLNVGAKNRMIGATLMNQSSSRSHSIFTISIEQIARAEDNNNEAIRKGKLNLVDLAGSERQAKTGATGDRLKEATKINLSLSALGNVISALVDGKAKHIPYRDSKLTRLLQDSLGGNTRTLMIACISPASRNYVETLSTLRYANRAKNIHNQPRVNEDPKDTMLRKYQEEIDRLRHLLDERVNSPVKLTLNTIISDTTKLNDTFDMKRDKLIQEYQTEMLTLKNLHENERNEKETIIKQMEHIKRDYQESLEKLNNDMHMKQRQKIVSKEELLKRLQTLKDAMIGGEKANDKELSDKRRRKKMASEKRLNAIAHVLAKIDMNEDREILQNQYKDISHELNLKTDMLRRYKHKVKSLEKEITDIQSEFEEERQDYLETIRKQDRHIKLLAQISDKIASTLKKECNYSDLENIKEQAMWLDESQKYKLPELVVHRTKLPPAGARISSSNSENSSHPSTPKQDEFVYDVQLEKSVKDDIAGNYFIKPKRAAELLNQSRTETSKAFNTWRGSINVSEYTKRNKMQSNELAAVSNGSPNGLSHSYNGLSSLWLNGTVVSPEASYRRPLRLEALPTVEKRRKNHKLNTLDLI
ncbi:Kinesin family member 3C [Carabus blaptoides fortunei]